MFIVDRQELLDACTIVSRIISNRPLMPILSCLRLETTDKGALKVSGTDMEIELVATVHMTNPTLKPTVAYVESSLFVQSLRELNGEEVEGVKGSKNLKVTSDKNTLLFPLGDDSKVPTMFEMKPSKTWDLSTQELLQGFNRSFLASADKEGEYAYDRLQFDGRMIVGTDGKRITFQQVSEIPTEDTKITLIPQKPTSVLMSMLRMSRSDKTSFAVSDNLCQVTSGNFQITFTNSSAKSLPKEMERMIPKTILYPTQFKVRDILKGISLANIMASKEAMRTCLDFEKGKLTVRMHNTKGKVDSEVAGDIPESMTMKIYLDPSWLKDILRTLPLDETVSIGFNGPEKIIAIKIPLGWYLIAPMYQK